MRLSANQGLAAAFLDDLRILIQDVAMPRDNATPAPCLGLEGLDSGNHLDSVAESDGKQESPFEDRQKGHRINPRCMADQTGCDGQAQNAMGHRTGRAGRARGRRGSG